MTSLALLLASWFGCGYVRKGPGTVASAAAVAIAIVLHQWVGATSYAIGILGLVAGAVGIWAAGVAITASGIKDPQFVVIDEVAGQWITITGAVSVNWKSWLAAFLLFRLFDIWKPTPIRRLESLPGGVGVMADDILAGVYGAAALYGAGLLNWY